MALSDTQTFTGITTDTATFQLWGGRYSVSAVPTANWSLQRLLPDGVTWFSETGLASNTSVVVELGPGSYRLHINAGTATGDDFEIVRF